MTPLRALFGLGALVLTSSREPLLVGMHAEMLRDSTATMSPDQVMSPRNEHLWRPVTVTRPNLGYTSDVVWLRFAVRATDSTRWILDVGREWLEHVDLFRVDGDRVVAVQRSGASLPVHRRAIVAERPAFEIAASADHAAEYLLRIESRSPISLLGELRPVSSYNARYAVETLVMGGFYAVLLAMAAYNFLLFARLREPAQGWLAVYIGSYALGELASHGHLGRLAGASGIELQLGAAAFAVMVAASIRFMRTALPLDQLAGAWRSILRAALVTLPAGCLAAVVFPQLHVLTWISLGLMVVVNLALGCASVRSRHRLAMLIVYAQAALLLPGTLSIGAFLGALPVHPATEHGNHIGAILMVVLFSLAVAEKIEGVRVAATRFVPRDFLAALGRRDITEVRIGDARDVDMTVMFVDLRAFTTLAESLPAPELFARVNRWFARAVPAITAHGGFVDKFIGDAIMALFASPAAALRAAVELRRASAGEFPIGIGLHTGPMTLGTVGHADRLDVSVIADSVNVASRVEGLTRHFGVDVLASRNVLDAAGRVAGLGARWVGSVRVKGRSAPIDVLEIGEFETLPNYGMPTEAAQAAVIAMDSK